jgi:hypothetical protein
VVVRFVLLSDERIYNERFRKLRDRLSERNVRLIKQMERERLDYTP